MCYVWKKNRWLNPNIKNETTAIYISNTVIGGDEDNQFTTIKDTETWVHHDDTTLATVIYLTPDAPLESGTAMYRHKKTGIFNWSPEDKIDNNKSKEVNDLNNWEQIMFVANIYNRMVLYRGSLYHRSVLPGFGHDKYTGRLFQTFFFNTE